MEVKKEEKTGSWWQLKNSKGKPDAVLTLTLVSFILCCLMAIGGMLETISIGTFSLVMREFDISFASIIFIPLLSAYIGKRWNDNTVSLKETQMLAVEHQKARVNKKQATTEEVPNED